MSDTTKGSGAERSFEVDRGSEAYRGHLLVKRLRANDTDKYWRVDVVTLGMPDAKPLAFVQLRVADGSLAKAVSEAKLLVGQMIFHGTDGDVPASAVAVDHGVFAEDPFDAFVMRTATGKSTVCLRHWGEWKRLAGDGKLNVLVLGMMLMIRFTDKLRTDGLLVENYGSGYTLNTALDAHSPICCFLGDEVLAQLVADADPSVILLARARADG
jgi:hypothetical protein